MNNYRKQKTTGLRLAPVIVGILMVTIVIIGLNVLQGFVSRDGGTIIPAISLNTDSNPSYKRKSLVMASPKYSGFFNPLYIGSEIDEEITRLLFDPLVEADKTGKAQPVLADFEITDGGKQYTFTLKNAKFSDGTPVTAADVEFTYYVLCDPAYDGPVQVADLGIVGYDEYVSGKTDTLSGISVDGTHKITIRLKKPNPSAIFTLGLSPLAKGYYGTDFVKGNLDNIKLLRSRPMGCGQFTFTNFDATRLVLEKNRNYYRGKIVLENATFLVTKDEEISALLENGDVDLDLTKSYAGSSLDFPFLVERTYSADSYGFLGINSSATHLQDPLVRQALALSIDKKAFITSAFQGQAVPLDAPLSHTSYSYPTDQAAVYDLEQAKSKLTAAGYIKNSDGVLKKAGKTLSLTYATTVGNQASEVLGKQLELACESLGIALKNIHLDYGSLYSQVENGLYDLWFMAAEVSPEPMPYDFFGTDGMYNLFHYSNRQVDTLATQATTDTALLPDLWKLLSAELPIIPLYQRNEMITFNKRLEGLEFSPFFPVCEGLYRILQ